VAQLRGLKVLAVDDDPDARQLVRTVLEDCGALVRVVPSAADAVLAIQEELPQVLAAGYSLHVPKPIEPAHLVAVVAALAGAPATLGEAPRSRKDGA